MLGSTLLTMPSEPAPAKTPWRAIGVMIVIVVVGILAVLPTRSVAQAYGGGIDAQVVRKGTGYGLHCSRSLWSFGLEWSCTADRLDLVEVTPLPGSVTPLGTNPEILASSDLTGKDVVVTTHLPSNWETSTRRSDALPIEIAVAAGHPVGSAAWGAFRVFAGPAILVTLAAAAVGTVIWHLRRSRGRRHPLQQRR